jgi:hypothetical protein
MESIPNHSFTKIVVDTDDDGPYETVPSAGTSGICQAVGPSNSACSILGFFTKLEGSVVSFSL